MPGWRILPGLALALWLAWPAITVDAGAAFPAGPGTDQFNATGVFQVTFHPNLGLPSTVVWVQGPTKVIYSGPHPDSGMADASGQLGDGSLGCAINPGISDNQIGFHPPGYELGPKEVHTMICDMNMTRGGWSVRAGISAPSQPPSLGEVESEGGPGGGFPARSFFSLYVEVFDPLNSITLVNLTPLLVEARIDSFPPANADYLHSFDILGRVELYDLASGCFIGWLEQGLHGVTQTDTIMTHPPPLVSPVVFSVDIQAEGLLIPDPCAGVPPGGGHAEPNDVYALGLSPWAGFYPTEGEIFQSPFNTWDSDGADMTNVDRMSAALGVGPLPGGPPPYTGPFWSNAGQPLPPPGFATKGTLGMVPGDNMDALSFGMDGGNVLLFSVDPEAVGLPGTAVDFHASLSPFAAALPGPPRVPDNLGGDPGHEAAGDIYASRAFPYFGPRPPLVNLTNVPEVGLGSNRLVYDENLLGLQAPAQNHSHPTPPFGPPEDDVDALEMDDARRVDDGNPYDGIPDNGKYVFFSLDATSATVIAPTPDPFPGTSTDPDTTNGVTADDILVSSPPGQQPFNFAIYARGIEDMGLQPGDDLDALCLWDNNPNGTGPPDGILNTEDEALFSLAAGSPSLGGRSPGDVFLTKFDGQFTLYTSAASLGLNDFDDLNALDINPGVIIPTLSEWGVIIFGILLLGSLVLFIWRRRRLATTATA
jgi:hypothetical protein